jgi:hypothetical protein
VVSRLGIATQVDAHPGNVTVERAGVRGVVRTHRRPGLGTLQCALRRGTVVADHQVHQRVVEDRLDGVEQSADVVVGVLKERGVDLHLPLERWPQRRIQGVPGRDLAVSRGEHGIGRDDTEFALAVKGGSLRLLAVRCGRG